MCCNRFPCCDNDTSNFPFYLPVSQDDLARLAELASVLETIQGLQNVNFNGCGCNCGCNNSCRG